ncbi:MAG: heat shock protein HspQ [Sphingomonas sp.]
MPPIAHANFSIGDIVRHRIFDFRGVVFDVDPVFANSEEWYDAIPVDIRPRKDQPFYHLLAENTDSTYVAYVSQQNLIADDSEEPVDHPAISGLFTDYVDGKYRLRREHRH